MFLVNFVALKCEWLDTIANPTVINGDFTPLNGRNKVQVKMLILNEILNVQFSPAELEADTCEIPFKNGISMTIILPHTDVNQIEKKLNARLINAVLSVESKKKQLVTLFLPDIKIRSDIRVNLAYLVKKISYFLNQIYLR